MGQRARVKKTPSCFIPSPTRIETWFGATGKMSASLQLKLPLGGMVPSQLVLA
jgi:hypothetical protein